jgi:PAS domain S-box-containing protein
LELQLNLFPRQINARRTTLPAKKSSQVIETSFLIALSDSPIVLSVSESIHDLLGFKADDFLRDKVALQSRIHSHDQDIADELFSSDIKQATGTFNIRIRNADDRICCARGQYTKAIEKKDNNLTLRLVLQDAKSLWKRPTEKAMMANFKSMMENTNDYIYFKDRNHVFTGASQTLVAITDPSEYWTDLLGKTDYDVFPEAYADTYYSLEKKVFAGIDAAHEVQETLDNEGNKGWVDNRKYPIRDEHNELIGLFGIARDITESKKLEENLFLGQARLNEAQQLTHVGSWDLDVKKDELYWSDEQYRIFGLEIGTKIDVTQGVSVFHPDDRQKVRAHVDAAIEQKKGFEFEHRLIRADGEERICHCIGKTRLDQGGEVASLYGTFQDITERKQSEEKLRLTEKRFKTIFEEAPLGAALIDSLTGDIYEVNPRFAEIAGRTIEEMATIDWMSITHPDDVQEDLDNMEALNKGKIDGFNMNKRYIKPDGSQVWINMTIAPITVEDKKKPRHLCMIEDITQRKEFENELEAYRNNLKQQVDARTHELKKSKESLASLISNLNGMVYHCENDKNWTMDFVSEGSIPLTGYEPSEIEKNNKISYNEIIHPDDRERVWEEVQEAIENKEPFILNYRITTSDGNVKHVWEQGRGVWLDNWELDGLEGYVTDITNEVESRKDLARTQEMIAHSDKLASLGQLVGSVAHEFNNPLFGVMNLVDQLADDDLADQKNDLSRVAIKECQRMADMIKNLQNFYKPSEGIHSSIVLNNIIDDVLMIIGKEIKAKRITITKNYDDNLVPIEVVEDQIKQVIINLLQNASDAMEENEGELTLTTQQSESNIKLRIQDNGAGISEENIRKLFDPFFTTKGVKGTGLGLSVSYGIIKKHGGNIDVESESGKGSIFTVTLPIKRNLQ